MAIKKKAIILKQIGLNIRKLRRLRDLTQDELSKQIGLSRVSVVNIEAGRQAIPIYNIPIMCEAWPWNMKKVLTQCHFLRDGIMIYVTKYLVNLITIGL